MTVETHEVAPAILSPTRPLYWSVMRELWENRSIYIAPVGVAGVFFFGFLNWSLALPRPPATLAALPPDRAAPALSFS